jgi:hypothetical protein
VPVTHARAAVSSLLVMLADITDPRDPRGVRHPLVAVLGVAVVATLAGAANYRELGSVAADLPQELLSLLGTRWDPAGSVFIAPSAGMLRRVLFALDGKDLRGSWNDDGRLVLFSAMTHRTERQDVVVLGQITVPEGTTETTQVRTLLGEMNIAGAQVTADAAHTCADTARYLVEDCRADYLLTIKGSRASLHAAAIATGRDLVAAEPGHIAEERGHGRINRWTTWTTHTDSTAWARNGLPHATRLAVIRRDVADLAGQPLSKEIVFVAPSRADLTAAEISAHTRRHWGAPAPRHRLARGRPAGPPRQRPPSHGHPAQPGPRPVRHPRHHQDQADRPVDRPQPAPRHPTDHITSHPVINGRL